ncbi:MAG: MBL fold metallo-hydrolase [Verrucomicrobiota bacterium]
MSDPITQPILLKFWGVRGSVPAPGPSTASIGGNTACVELRSGDDILILDAGTGIRSLGLVLDEEFKGAELDLTLLLSHTHWDHIQGLPFFQPAYRAQTHLRILGCKPPVKSLRDTLFAQMGSDNFPVSMADMPANITIAEINAPVFSIGRVQVLSGRVNHPGAALGYRLNTGRGTIVYVPDCEPVGWNAASGDARPVTPGPLFNATGAGLLEFIRGADVLIFDGQYDRREYDGRIGWGHACVDDTVELAMAAGVQQLFIFHHDPEHDDERVLQMLSDARKKTAEAGNPLKIEIAREGLEVLL